MTEPTISRSEVRDLSRRVFGQDHMLGVGLIFSMSDQPLSLSDLARAMGLEHASSLQATLRRLIAGGFVIQIPSEAGDRSRPYERLESSFWPLVNELYGRTASHHRLFD